MVLTKGDWIAVGLALALCLIIGCCRSCWAVDEYGPLGNGNVYDATDYAEYMALCEMFVNGVGLQEYFRVGWEEYTNGAPILTGTMTYTNAMGRHNQTLNSASTESVVSNLYRRLAFKALRKIARHEPLDYPIPSIAVNILIRDATEVLDATKAARIEGFWEGLKNDPLAGISIE